MLSDELPRLTATRCGSLLGEDLIAFRDTTGDVGLIQNNCPHRGASLFFGRNEEAGLRCVYHGWKFDIDGDCVDMPNEPAESDFKDKVRAVAYPTRERGGVVWAYMGPRATPPPLPDLEGEHACQSSRGTSPSASSASATGCRRWKATSTPATPASCTAPLHRGRARPGTRERYPPSNKRAALRVARDRRTACAWRPPCRPDDAHYFWRITHFLMPFYNA